MRRFILSIFATLCSLNMSAQNMMRVEGEVKDCDGAPIVNATISVRGTNQKYQADANGKFSIEIPTHLYVITAYTNGYKAKTLEVDGMYMIFTLKASKNAKEPKMDSAASGKEYMADVNGESLVVNKEAKRLYGITEKLNKYISYNIQSHRNLSILTPTETYTALGDNYFFGKGVAFDTSKAFLCYNLGAQKGEKEAFLRLAQMFYEKGRSDGKLHIEPSVYLALLFYEKAASLGVDDARVAIERLRKK